MAGGGATPGPEPRWLWDHDFGTPEPGTNSAFLRWVMSDREDAHAWSGIRGLQDYFLEAFMAEVIPKSPYPAGGVADYRQDLIGSQFKTPDNFIGTASDADVLPWVNFLHDDLSPSYRKDVVDDLTGVSPEESRWGEFLRKFETQASDTGLAGSYNLYNAFVAPNNLDLSGAINALIDAAENQVINVGDTGDPLMEKISKDAQVEVPLIYADAEGDVAGKVNEALSTEGGGADSAETVAGAAAETAAGRAHLDAHSAAGIVSGILSGEGSNEGRAAANYGFAGGSQIADDIFSSDNTTLTTTLRTDATNQITAAVTSAIAAAQSVIDGGSYIDDLVDDYEDEAKPAYHRAMNRFAGGMADINAVQTSSFLFGAAQIENAFRRDVEKFRHTLKVEAYNRIITTYLDTFSRVLAFYLDAYVQQLRAYLSTFEGVLNNYGRAYLSSYANSIQAFAQSYGNFAQLYASGVQGNMAMAQAFESDSVRAFASTVDSHVRSYITNKLERQNTLAQFHMDAVRMMTGTLYKKADVIHNYSGELGRLSAMATTAYREEALDSIAVGKGDLLWKMDVVKEGAQILSASGGGIGYTQERMSQGQSALAYGLAGASVGAMAGGPAGAAVGGVAGLIGGYFAK